MENTPKIQPSDIGAEQAVLGSMMIDKDSLASVIEIIKPEDFYREDHKEIYSAILDLYEFSKPIDMLTVKEQLKIRGSLEQVGDVGYLSSLTMSVPYTANIDSYVKVVEEKSLLRKLIKSSSEIVELGYAQSEEVDYIVEQAEKKIFDVLQKRNTRGYSSIKDILIDTFEMIEKLYNKKVHISGISTGFIDLDLKTSGLNPSDLIMIAARPGMGKSALVLNMAHHIAVKQKMPVAVFSLEMAKEQMVNRILCSDALVDNMKVRTGKLEEEDWIKLGKSLADLSDAPIYIDDTPGLSAAELRAKCRKMKLEKNIGVIIIDYLQLMSGKGKSGENRQQEISEISRSLKILAKELGVPVIALSQLSRATESRTDKRPMLSDLRESGSIEQDADIVMFIYRDDYYNPDTEKKNIAEVIIAKNRSGSTGTIELVWQGQFTKFNNLHRG